MIDELNEALDAYREEIGRITRQRDEALARVAELEAAIDRVMQMPLHAHDDHWCSSSRDFLRALGDAAPPPSGEAIAGLLSGMAERATTPPVYDVIVWLMEDNHWFGKDGWTWCKVIDGDPDDYTPDLPRCADEADARAKAQEWLDSVRTIHVPQEG